MSEHDHGYTLCAIGGGPKRASKPRRRRLWYISPEGFQELRHSCLLSRKACAAYLGVCLRTIRYWEAGRCRVPWSAVRLLRLWRSGELGGLDAAWEGWTITRHGLRSPCGRVFPVASMGQWWLTVEQARFWRQGYEAATRPSAGEHVPDAVRPGDGDPLLIAMPGRSADTLPALSVGDAPPHPCRTALEDRQGAIEATSRGDDGTPHASAASGRRSAGALGFISNATSDTQGSETASDGHRAGGAS